MSRQTGRWTVILFVLLGWLGGCSPRQKVARSIQATKTQLERGDAALVQGDAPSALAAYRTAQASIDKGRPHWKALPATMASSAQDVAEAVDLRLQAFEAPIGAATAAFRLIGLGEDTLSLAFWDTRSMARIGFDEEKWQSMSPDLQGRVSRFGEDLLLNFVGNNRTFFKTVSIRVLEESKTEYGVVLRCEFSLEPENIIGEVICVQNGSLWQVADLGSEAFSIQLSQLIFRTMELVEAIRPLEEIFDQPDATEVLLGAASMAFDEY